jgi:hypothetical protein
LRYAAQDQNVTMNDSIASRASSDLISRQLAQSIFDASAAVRAAPVVAPYELTPEEMFGHAIDSAIQVIERRGELLRRFVFPGPYEEEGSIPDDDVGRRLSDDDTERAVTMLYCHVVNSFKGQIAEILSLAPCAQLFEHLRSTGRIPENSLLYVGDAARPRSSRGLRKGADLHMISRHRAEIQLEGVVEVKSFHRKPDQLAQQLHTHVQRARQGMSLRGEAFGRIVPTIPAIGPAEISVSLSNWPLSRGFHFEEQDGRSFLHFDPLPNIPEDIVSRIDDRRWHIELGWSQEALCAEAYGLTFWYLTELGVDLFSDRGSPWPEMTPKQAGINAATQSMFHAVNRSRSRRAEQRAIALYNVLGFGYSLGTSYKDKAGRRHMLWESDLRAMLHESATDREVRLRN